ncbi:MAG: AMP-binding protein [Burkholderiales bacterium]|nr:AMP-binding protein [Burkholderiales bacterium]
MTAADLPQDIGALLDAQARLRPDAPAILEPNEQPLSYAGLARWIAKARLDLRRAGVTQASRVALLMPPGPEAALATLATMCCATCVPVNPEASADELEAWLRDTGVAFIVAPDDGRLPRAATGLRRIVYRRTKGAPGGDLVAIDSDAPPAPANAGRAIDRADAIALLLPTSGTTARPKRVPLSHRNVLPLLHIGGLVHGLLTTLASGGSVVCPRGFDASRFFDLVADLRPTWYTGTPTIHLALLPFLDEYRRLAAGHRFRFLRSASAPMPPMLIEQLERAFDAPLIEGYGMTEAGRITCNPLPPGRRKPGSVGKPVALEVRIVDTDGADCAPEQTGEILIRGGKKVAPREVDEALLALPGVREAAAFGVPHPSLGEDLWAAVVAEPGSHLDTGEMRRVPLDRLARDKVPSEIVVVGQLPRGNSGKVQRSQLPALVAQRPSGSPDTPRTREEVVVARAFEAVLGQAVVTVDDNFFLLGGDSLSAARVVARLKAELGLVTLPEVRLVFEFPTVAALAAELGRPEPEPQLDTALLARIDELSDEEVERMLAEETLSLPDGWQQ